jgi:hypothetical protein
MATLQDSGQVRSRQGEDAQDGIAAEWKPARSWLIFALVTLILLWALHAVAFFAHEFAHSFSAWLLGLKADPLALNYGHLTPGNILLQVDIDENVEYDLIFAAGHDAAAGFIAAAGMVIGNGFLTYPISLLGFHAAGQRGARGWGLFSYWFCVASVGNFIDYVPDRTFASHGDMHTLARAFNCSPWWILVVLGIPVALALIHFLFFAPRAFQWLFPQSPARRMIMVLLTTLALFGFYGAVGWSGYGQAAHVMSAISVYGLLPAFALSGCWQTSRQPFRI